MAAAVTPRSGPVDEIAGAVRLAGPLVDVVTRPIQDAHRGIASRVFGLLGPIAAPVRHAHDAIAGLSYASARMWADVAGRTLGGGVGLTSTGVDRRPISAHPRGALALSFFDALFGDWLDGRADDLVIRPGLTVTGSGPATARVAVFVHGLAETTAVWSWWGDSATPYATRLARHGWTAVDVAYGSGRRVGESGAAVADLLSDLLERWPTPIEEVALIGHSMGGMVVRTACETGLDVSHEWVDRVSHVVTLGAPHGGSWLAKAAHAGSAAAARLPETSGLSTFLELRSHGIHDLTTGAPVARDLSAEMPSARHVFVSAGLSGPLDRLVGDGLVHRSSATAPAVERHNVIIRHHHRVGHVRLLNHPDVGDDLEAWLGTGAPDGSGSASRG